MAPECRIRDTSSGQRVVDAETRHITRESSCRIRPYSNGIVIEPKPDPTIACIMGFMVLIKHTRYVYTTTNDDDCFVEHCMCAIGVNDIRPEPKGTYDGSNSECDESDQTNELNVNCIRYLYRSRLLTLRTKRNQEAAPPDARFLNCLLALASNGT
jgi:hypothetical protein